MTQKIYSISINFGLIKLIDYNSACKQYNNIGCINLDKRAYKEEIKEISHIITLKEDNGKF